MVEHNSRYGYPDRFAYRFLEYLVASSETGAVVSYDFADGWIQYAEGDPDDVPVGGGRMSISDTEIAPFWDAIVKEGLAFYPSASNEQAAMAILAVGIKELQDTDGRASPRAFSMSEVTSVYPPD